MIISLGLSGTIVNKDFFNSIIEGYARIYSKLYKTKYEETLKRFVNQYNRFPRRSLEKYSFDYWLTYFKIPLEKSEKVLDIASKKLRFEERHTRKIIKDLSEKYKMVIITNIDRKILLYVLRKLKLTKYFTRVISATSDYRTFKTAPFYKAIMKELRSKIIHIGDDLSEDYREVLKAKGKAIFYAKNFENKHHLVRINYINSIKELANKLLY